MLFNSYSFLFLFLPITLIGFYWIGQKNKFYAGVWLAFASIFFYGYWSIYSLPLLLGSILFNYWISQRIVDAENQKNKKRLLILGLVVNLTLLGFFKYANFFIENLNTISKGVGYEEIALIKIALPIGISFFTFTQIAFLVDCWQSKVKERNFTHYVLFVTYFPHLIAGPVLHHQQMMPQFADSSIYKVDFNKWAIGITIFVFGLAKKLLIADSLGQYADGFFNGIANNQNTPNFVMSWIGVLSYTLQIYFDFSGYSDMAIGLSLLFGIYLPINFNSPYKAKNIIDFWRRWHVSLSTFLRDYLYIPLGGGHKGPSRRYLNLVITMLLGGLWHGANWTFVLWGLAHGMLLLVNHAWREFLSILGFQKSILKAFDQSKTWGVFSWILTFLAVMFCWVLFRADDLNVAFTVYKGLLGLNGFDGEKWGWISVRISYSEFWRTLPIALLIALFAKQTKEYFVQNGQFKTNYIFIKAIGILIIFFVSVGRIGWHSPFLYFQF